MPYCLMDLHFLGEDQGWAPAFPPEVTGFSLLADARSIRWGLYHYSLAEDATWFPDEPVQDGLRRLINSGKKYPPALALARNHVERRFATSTPTRAQFLGAYADALQRALGDMPQANFVIAPAVVEWFPYLSIGEWYWVLGFSSPERTDVWWVCDEIFIYKSPAQHFDLTDGRGELLRVLGDK